jgi:calnexin
MIDNPLYKGVWAPRKIPNPNFFVDNEPHRMQPMVSYAHTLLSIISSRSHV